MVTRGRMMSAGLWARRHESLSLVSDHEGRSSVSAGL
jgi:hypothetical protein